eukprot:4369980-Pleurochrysis_carterae.AAC.1
MRVAFCHALRRSPTPGCSAQLPSHASALAIASAVVRPAPSFPQLTLTVSWLCPAEAYRFELHAARVADARARLE